MNQTSGSRASEIAALEEKLARLKGEQAYYERLTPQAQLAEELHKVFCHDNHIDACDWTYGNWENSSGLTYSRKRYLGYATKLLERLCQTDGCSTATKLPLARDIVTILSGIR